MSAIEDALIQYYWIDGDSNEFYLSPDTTNERYLVEVAGLGLPPVERLTIRRPYRHGQLRRGASYLGRTIDLVLAFRSDSPTALWTDMADWASAFNLERGVGTLKMVLQDGTERRIDCEVADAIALGSEQRPNSRTQIVAVPLVADDPMLYNPSQQTASDDFDGSNNVDITCTNNGDVKTWPVIEIDGEVVNPVITLVGTSETLTFSYTIAAGTTVTIDCGAGTITLGDGTNLMDKIAKTDEFFQLLTGANTVRITADSGTSECAVKWYERFASLHA